MTTWAGSGSCHAMGCMNTAWANLLPGNGHFWLWLRADPGSRRCVDQVYIEGRHEDAFSDNRNLHCPPSPSIPRHQTLPRPKRCACALTVAPPPARCRDIHGRKDYLAIAMSKECPLWLFSPRICSHRLKIINKDSYMTLFWRETTGAVPKVDVLPFGFLNQFAVFR